MSRIGRAAVESGQLIALALTDLIAKHRSSKVTERLDAADLRLVEALGNVLLSARASGLPKQSVVDVSQVVTLDRAALAERAGRVDPETIRDVDRGLRLVLSR